MQQLVMNFQVGAAALSRPESLTPALALSLQLLRGVLWTTVVRWALVVYGSRLSMCGCVVSFPSLLLSASSPAPPTPPSRKGKGSRRFCRYLRLHITRTRLGKYSSLSPGELYQGSHGSCTGGSTHTQLSAKGTRTAVHPGVYLPRTVGSPRPHLSRGRGAPCVLAVLCLDSGL